MKLKLEHAKGRKTFGLYLYLNKEQTNYAAIGFYGGRFNFYRTKYTTYICLGNIYFQ